MAQVHLSEKVVKAAQAVAGRKVLLFDDDCRGFALSVASSGTKTFVLDYTMARRQRRITIGAWPTWSVVAAREEAQLLKREIDRGVDPLAKRREKREAPRISDLVRLYREQHLPRLAPRNASDQVSMLERFVLPEWGARLVEEITPADVERLLDIVAEGRARPCKAAPKNRRRAPLAPSKPTPVRANRAGEVIRKMFTIALEAKPPMRLDNPAARFRRRDEVAKETFLTPDQVLRLALHLESEPDQRGASILRMCMLTGARLGEVRTARFDQFNTALGIWTKQAAETKQRRVHRLPISADTVALVEERRRAVSGSSPYLFPGDVEGQPVVDIRRFWARVKAAADLPETIRIHDLRHTFASLLVSGGASLEVIGKLLGHTQAKTTARYAHLLESPLRASVDAVGASMRPRLRVVGE